MMRVGIRHIVFLLVGAVALGLAVAWSGVISVKASTGHYKVTDWFLHWVMRSSIRTAAIGTEVPVYTDGMLPMAAGHFEAGCAICHGSPAEERPAATRRMLPPPPDLTYLIPTWSDAELFQIVQHGVRYTGMPAWPAEGREDEAWALVAFLRAYPGLDADRYGALVGERTMAEGFDGTVAGCNSCHASDRLDGQSLIPRLSGQSATYLTEALEAYLAGKRQSGVMAVALRGVDQTMATSLAEQLSRPTGPTAAEADAHAEPTRRGRELAEKGDPDRGIAACHSCHDREGANPAFPLLSSQPRAYLENQLRLFADDRRGGGRYNSLMVRAVENLDANDIEALARYFSDRSLDAHEQ